jgi:expansin
LRNFVQVSDLSASATRDARSVLSRWVILIPLFAASASAPPPTPEPRSGVATYTDLTGGGTCSMPGEPADNLHIGLPSSEYGTADLCGGYVDVTGPKGTVRVLVTDHCPRCPSGVVDVTRTAFAQIADVGQGRVPVTYSLVRNPWVPGTISLRMKSGSSSSWMQIQALDHGNPIAAVELQTGAGWRSLVHTSDNYWTAANPGPGPGPFVVRLTDVFGQTVTIPDVALVPDAVQPTEARLYPSETVPAVVPSSAGSPSAPIPAPTTPLPVPETQTGTTAPPPRRARGARASDPGPEGQSIFALFVLLAALGGVARLVSTRRLHRPRHRHLLR